LGKVYKTGVEWKVVEEARQAQQNARKLVQEEFDSNRALMQFLSEIEKNECGIKVHSYARTSFWAFPGYINLEKKDLLYILLPDMHFPRYLHSDEFWPKESDRGEIARLDRQLQETREARFSGRPYYFSPELRRYDEYSQTRNADICGHEAGPALCSFLDIIQKMPQSARSGIVLIQTGDLCELYFPSGVNYVDYFESKDGELLKVKPDKRQELTRQIEGILQQNRSVFNSFAHLKVRKKYFVYGNHDAYLLESLGFAGALATDLDRGVSWVWPKGGRFECWIRRHTKARRVYQHANGLIGWYKYEGQADFEKGADKTWPKRWRNEDGFECWIVKDSKAETFKPYKHGIIGVYGNKEDAHRENERWLPVSTTCVSPGNEEGLLVEHGHRFDPSNRDSASNWSPRFTVLAYYAPLFRKFEDFGRWFIRKTYDAKLCAAREWYYRYVQDIEGEPFGICAMAHTHKPEMYEVEVEIDSE